MRAGQAFALPTVACLGGGGRSIETDFLRRRHSTIAVADLSSYPCAIMTFGISLQKEHLVAYGLNEEEFFRLMSDVEDA